MSSRNEGQGGDRPRQARRLQRPGWKDLRLVVGLLLVLLSVAGGIRLVGELDETTPVYAAARDLVPGQALSEQDVAVVQVRMGDTLARYVDGAAELTSGTYLLHGVRAGELVPASALGTAQQALDKTVSVPVDQAAAASLTRGTVVDVWVSRREDGAVGEAYQDPELLLAGAQVDGVPADGNRLGVGVGRTAVHVVVPAEQVGSVIAAVDQGARITLVPTPGAPTETGR